MCSRCAQAPGQLDPNQRCCFQSSRLAQQGESILSNVAMTVLHIFMLLQTCSTVALNSGNLSLHTVEKFRVCLPEHETAVHSKIFAAVPAERLVCPVCSSFCRDSSGDL